MAVLSQDVSVAYWVEVSGWDNRQEFFVEKMDLEWSEEEGKLVLLSRPVADGSLLFLRLLISLTLGICRSSCSGEGRAGEIGRTGAPLSLDEVRKQHIQRVPGMCKRNRLRASQVLGIGRTSLYRYLKQHGYEDVIKVRSATNGP